MKRERTSPRQNKTVLVCVLKSKRDLQILLAERWYRIPSASKPTCPFQYLAFYQPVVFGRHGKRIEYYGRVLKSATAPRICLLPDETEHPRAHQPYEKIEMAWVKKLARPIRNIIPRRISFGFTDLKSLLRAGDILELYGVAPTEQIIYEGLGRRGTRAVKEFNISKGGRRYRIDLAVFCQRGAVAVECDNRKAHSGAAQKNKDKRKDLFLRRHGWRVVRLREQDIIERLPHCLARVRNAIEAAGGQAKFLQGLTSY